MIVLVTTNNNNNNNNRACRPCWDIGATCTQKLPIWMKFSLTSALSYTQHDWWMIIYFYWLSFCISKSSKIERSESANHITLRIFLFLCLHKFTPIVYLMIYYHITLAHVEGELLWHENRFNSNYQIKTVVEKLDPRVKKIVFRAYIQCLPKNSPRVIILENIYTHYLNSICILIVIFNIIRSKQNASYSFIVHLSIILWFYFISRHLTAV